MKKNIRPGNFSFVKMHGLGNDYVYLEDDGSLEHLPELAKIVAHRHFGVGSDGLVLIMPSDTDDFRMRMFNADGSEAEMCGNAIRCLGRYVYDRGLTQKSNLRIETLAGRRYLRLETPSGATSPTSVQVDMGEPIFEGHRIPCTAPNPERVLVSLSGFQGQGFSLSMGNPHVVFFVSEIRDFMLSELGPRIEHHEFFPERVNVEFVEVLAEPHSDESVGARKRRNACLRNWSVCECSSWNSPGLLEENVRVELLGGELLVQWTPSKSVYQAGPAEFICEGVFHEDLLSKVYVES